MGRVQSDQRALEIAPWPIIEIKDVAGTPIPRDLPAARRVPGRPLTLYLVPRTSSHSSPCSKDVLSLLTLFPGRPLTPHPVPGTSSQSSPCSQDVLSLLTLFPGRPLTPHPVPRTSPHSLPCSQDVLSLLTLFPGRPLTPQVQSSRGD